MGKKRQLSVTDVAYRPALAAPVGMDILDYPELATRAARRGLDLSTPLRPAFHQLIHISTGSARHTVDFQDYTLDVGSWLWVRAEQVHQYVPGDCQAPRGRIVIWRPGFIPSEPLSENSVMRPAGRQARHANLALRHLVQVYGDPGSSSLEAHIQTLGHLLSVLVLRLAQACPTPAALGAAGEVFRSFRAAVERDFSRLHHVSDYAAVLGYSVRTLTRAAQAATGSTAKQYLDARILLEARRLLAHTDATSAEISRRLGFPDPSDFTKFFRTRDGNAPLRFRETARGRAPGITSAT